MSDAQNIEALPDWGPKMKALANDRQRLFVCALFDAPPHGKGQHIWSAKAAGYGTPTSSNKALGVIAARLLQDEKVQAAVREESHRRLRLLPPAAITAIQKLIADPSHRDHTRALAMVLDRTDPVEVKHEVNVHHDAPTVEMTEQVLDRIEQLARRAGIASLPAPIEADFKVVSELP
jgi:phage terminase small subunit